MVKISYVSIPWMLFPVKTRTEFTRSSRIFLAATWTGSEGATMATLKTWRFLGLLNMMQSKSYLNRPSASVTYRELSDMMVDSEGLNTRSLSVSIKFNDAEMQKTATWIRCFIKIRCTYAKTDINAKILAN